MNEPNKCHYCGIEFSTDPLKVIPVGHEIISHPEGLAIKCNVPTPKHAGGRPTTYTQELGQAICGRISQGESLRSICKEEGMPHISTVMKWNLDLDKKQFSEQYEAACNTRAELLFEELLEIADTPQEGTETVTKGDLVEERKGDMLGHRKLQVDTRKWYLSKVMPKKFGDKLDLTSKDKALPAMVITGMVVQKEEKPENIGGEDILGGNTIQDTKPETA